MSGEVGAYVGAIVLATTVAFGLSGCAKQSGSADGAETTTDASETAEAGETTPDPSTDTGTTLGDTDDSASDSNDTSLSFYAGPDNDWIAVSECDPFFQDCPEGEKCVAYGSTGGNWDANKCVPVLGDGQPGDPCNYDGTVEATDDCGAESHCWDVMDVDGAAVGTCREFCLGTADAPLCPEGTSCLIANEGSITLCIATCDPLLQACDAGLACYWANDDFNCIFTTQDIPLGEPCGSINDCAPGTGCLTADVVPDCAGAACCASFCSLGEPLCPQPGTECAPFFEDGMAPPDYVDVGVCISPGA